MTTAQIDAEDLIRAIGSQLAGVTPPHIDAPTIEHAAHTALEAAYGNPEARALITELEQLDPERAALIQQAIEFALTHPGFFVGLYALEHAAAPLASDHPWSHTIARAFGHSDARAVHTGHELVIQHGPDLTLRHGGAYDSSTRTGYYGHGPGSWWDPHGSAHGGAYMQQAPYYDVYHHSVYGAEGAEPIPATFFPGFEHPNTPHPYYPHPYHHAYGVAGAHFDAPGYGHEFVASGEHFDAPGYAHEFTAGVARPAPPGPHRPAPPPPPGGRPAPPPPPGYPHRPAPPGSPYHPSIFIHPAALLHGRHPNWPHPGHVPGAPPPAPPVYTPLPQDDGGGAPDDGGGADAPPAPAPQDDDGDDGGDAPSTTSPSTGADPRHRHGRRIRRAVNAAIAALQAAPLPPGVTAAQRNALVQNLYALAQAPNAQTARVVFAHLVDALAGLEAGRFATWIATLFPTAGLVPPLPAAPVTGYYPGYPHPGYGHPGYPHPGYPGYDPHAYGQHPPFGLQGPHAYGHPGYDPHEGEQARRTRWELEHQGQAYHPAPPPPPGRPAPPPYHPAPPAYHPAPPPPPFTAGYEGHPPFGLQTHEYGHPGYDAHAYGHPGFHPGYDPHAPHPGYGMHHGYEPHPDERAWHESEQAQRTRWELEHPGQPYQTMVPPQYLQGGALPAPTVTDLPASFSYATPPAPYPTNLPAQFHDVRHHRHHHHPHPGAPPAPPPPHYVAPPAPPPPTHYGAPPPPPPPSHYGAPPPPAAPPPPPPATAGRGGYGGGGAGRPFYGPHHYGPGGGPQWWGGYGDYFGPEWVISQRNEGEDAISPADVDPYEGMQ